MSGADCIAQVRSALTQRDRVCWPSGKYVLGIVEGEVNVGLILPSYPFLDLYQPQVRLYSLEHPTAGCEWKFIRRPERELRALPSRPLTPAPPHEDAAAAAVSTVVTTRVQQDGRDLGPAPEGKVVVLRPAVPTNAQAGGYVEETTTTTTVTTVTTVRRRC